MQKEDNGAPFFCSQNLYNFFRDNKIAVSEICKNWNFMKNLETIPQLILQYNIVP